MNALALTPEDFDDAVGGYPVLVVEFVASTADPSSLDLLAGAQPDVAFGRVTPETGPKLGAMFGFPPGPGLVIFRDRIVLYCEPGAHSGDRIEGLIAQVRSLDMDAVRAAIEQEKQAEVALRMRRVCPTARRGQFPES